MASSVGAPTGLTKTSVRARSVSLHLAAAIGRAVVRWATALGPGRGGHPRSTLPAGVDAGGVGRQHAAEVTDYVGHAYLGRTPRPCWARSS